MMLLHLFIYFGGVLGFVYIPRLCYFFFGHCTHFANSIAIVLFCKYLLVFLCVRACVYVLSAFQKNQQLSNSVEKRRVKSKLHYVNIHIHTHFQPCRYSEVPISCVWFLEVRHSRRSARYLHLSFTLCSYLKIQKKRRLLQDDIIFPHSTVKHI